MAGPKNRLYHLAKGIAIRTVPSWIFGRFVPQYRHIHQASRIRRNLEQAPVPSRPEGKALRVLFFCTKWWGLHTGWESAIAHGLRRRGHDVRFVTCDRVVTVCESMIYPDFGSEQCLSCPAMLRTFLEKLGLPHESLRDFLPPERARAVKAAVDALPDDALFGFSHAGFAVGEIIGCSVARQFRQLDWPRDEAHIAYCRRFVYSCAVLAEIVPAYLERYRPDRIFLCNGKFYAEQLVMEAARRLGIPVITYERGNILDTLIFAVDKYVVPFDLAAGWKAFRDVPLDPAQEKRLDDYLGKRKTVGNGMVSFFGKDIQEDKAGITAALGLDPAKRTFVLFTNTIWDSAVYGEDTAFADMFAWVGHAIGFFRKRPDWQLVIRIHPAEVRVYWQTTLQKVGDYLAKHHPDLPSNVKVIPPESGISSYALMDLSDAGLAYSSSVGVEMSILGKPVVTAANSNYVHAGFTLDAVDPDDWDRLVSGIDFAPSAERTALAKRFAYLAYFQYMIPFKFAHEDIQARTFTLEYSTPEDLASPEMDLICAGIEGARPIYRGR